MAGAAAIAVFAWQFTDTGTSEAEAHSEMLGLAPLSLGNPQTAAGLTTTQPRLDLQSVPITVEARLPQPVVKTLKLGRGDTLSKVLIRAGVSPGEAQDAIVALKPHAKLRSLKVGQAVEVSFLPDVSSPDAAGDSGRFIGLRLPTDFSTFVEVSRQQDGRFVGSTGERALVTTHERAQARIDSSLFLAGTREGVPVGVMAELVRLYSWDVDFQRDIRKGDRFEILYERLETEDGSDSKAGNILYAALVLSGNTLPLYRFDGKNGIEYFNADGQSARKALMRTPIDGARLSSHYGKRRHPVLGYRKMHKGTDFAAPTGTPIYAAGSGTVVSAGRNGSFGNYVKIRHNGEYHTAYAHMHRIKVKKGQRVRQGQVIGSVGTTGRSTGPHLHYEVHRNGRQVNPMKVRMPSGRKLKGTELAQFQDVLSDIQHRWASLETNPELASNQ